MDFIYLVIGITGNSQEVLAVFDIEEDAKSYCESLEWDCAYWDKYVVETFELNAKKFYYSYTLTRYPLRKKNNEAERVVMHLGTPCEEDVGAVKIETNLRSEKTYSTVVFASSLVSASKIGNRIVKEFLDEYDDEDTITYLGEYGS